MTKVFLNDRKNITEFRRLTKKIKPNNVYVNKPNNVYNKPNNVYNTNLIFDSVEA